MLNAGEIIIIIIIIIERKDLGGVMSKDCKDTLQTLKTVTKCECQVRRKVRTEYLSVASYKIAAGCSCSGSIENDTATWLCLCTCNNCHCGHCAVCTDLRIY